MTWQRVVAVLLVAVALAGVLEREEGRERDRRREARREEPGARRREARQEEDDRRLRRRHREEGSRSRRSSRRPPSRRSQNAAAEAQKDQAAVAVSITDSGYDPYVIRVFSRGPGHGDEPLQGARKRDGRPGRVRLRADRARRHLDVRSRRRPGSSTSTTRSGPTSSDRWRSSPGETAGPRDRRRGASCCSLSAVGILLAPACSSSEAESPPTPAPGVGVRGQPAGAAARPEGREREHPLEP